MKKILIMLLFVSLILTTGCQNDNVSTLNLGLSNDNDVSIGVVLSYENDYSIYELALDDIKKLDSPININLDICYDNEDYTQGLSVAQEYCSNGKTIGVVGHLYSNICLSLKNVYEENKMPLLVPSVNSQNLLDENEQYIYQTVPDVLSESRLLTAISYFKDDVKNAVIIYSDTEYGNEFSKTLESTITEDKIISIIDKVCTPNVYKDFPVALEKWKALDFDTVFLTGDVDLYQYYVSAIKEVNPDINIYISFDMEDAILSDSSAYPYYDGIYQLAWSQYNYNQELQDLYTRFEDRFGYRPSSKEIQIYDNIMIIAKAIAYHNVRTPEDLKNFLDTSENIGSIYDNLYFENNKIQNKISFLQSYDIDGNIISSYYATNSDVYNIWDDYYSLDTINKYLKVSDYVNE